MRSATDYYDYVPQFMCHNLFKTRQDIDMSFNPLKLQVTESDFDLCNLNPDEYPCFRY